MQVGKTLNRTELRSIVCSQQSLQYIPCFCHLVAQMGSTSTEQVCVRVFPIYMANTTDPKKRLNHSNVTVESAGEVFRSPPYDKLQSSIRESARN